MAPWYDEPIAEVEGVFRNREVPEDSPWLSEDAVFDWSRSISDNRGTHQGTQALKTMLAGFLEAWSDVAWKVTSAEELDEERLLLTTRLVGRGRESGLEVEAHGAQVWEFDDDRRLTRATMFQSRDDAARELGLAE